MNGMTIKEIADLCSVGEQTIRDWIKAATKIVSVTERQEVPV